MTVARDSARDSTRLNDAARAAAGTAPAAARKFFCPRVN
jgi:hypothetical protein